MSENQMVEMAAKVRLRAYAPYSGFKVGAAVLTRAGAIFTGCNVENASFGVTICAERAAVFAAIAAGQPELIAIAIVTDALEPAMPCGACRQVLAEFNPLIKIIASTTQDERQEFVLTDLLPRANQGLPSKNV
jgi:cytidine deaminase